MYDIQKITEQLLPVARDAGAIEMKYFNAGKNPDADIMGKKDGSPVTQADQEAEAFIIQKLTEIAPMIPVVGEESVAAGTIPDISSGTFFLVDPLDGTKDFIIGSDQFTVNIALMENFKPVMGVIYAPVTKDLYYAVNGQAFYVAHDQAPQKIETRALPDKGLTVVSGKRYPDPRQMEKYLTDRTVNEVIGCSSSLKFCMLARGAADIYPRFSPTCEWDTAAGEAILRAAGGGLTLLDGSEFVYGKVEQKFLNQNFVAFAQST